MALDFRLPRFRLALAQNPRPRSAHLLRLLEASLLSFFQTHVVGNKGTCRFYYIAAAAGPRRRPSRTGRGDRRRRGVRHRPGERRQVGRLSAPHALLGAPTQSPAAAPPLANLISSRYLVMSPLPIDYPVARDDWRLGLAGPRGSASRADLPILRGALAARQPTHRRPRRRRAVHSLLTRPFWPLAGSSPQRYLPIQMGSPRFAALLLLLPRAGTPLSLKNTYWTASMASRGSHSHHPAQAPGAPGPRPPLIRTGARPHPRDRRHRRAQESVLPARRV